MANRFFCLPHVLDIVENGGNLKRLILDVSFSAHMPDTLEMPYKPIITGQVSRINFNSITEWEALLALQVILRRL